MIRTQRRGDWQYTAGPQRRGPRGQGVDAMGIIRRLFMLFWTGLVLAMIAAAIGALMARRRVVPAAAADANEIELRAIFEPIHFQSRATGFRGGTIECWYGGGVIDLRDVDAGPGRRAARGPSGLRRWPDHRSRDLERHGRRQGHRRRRRHPTARRAAGRRAAADGGRGRDVRRLRDHVRGSRGRAARSGRADPALGATRPDRGDGRRGDGTGEADRGLDWPAAHPRGGGWLRRTAARAPGGRAAGSQGRPGRPGSPPGGP